MDGDGLTIFDVERGILTGIIVETLHEIERIKLNRDNFERKRSVAVADFA